MTHQNITPAQAYTWLKNGEAVLIDVREPDEFKAEHIAYAASLPLGVVGALFPSIEIPAGKKVLFQCMRGRRGGEACDIIENLNAFSGEIFNIEGGIDAWKAQGLPVITVSTGKISIFRQVQMIIGSLIALLVLLGFAGLTLGFAVAGLLGGMLAFAGATGWCGLAMLLQKMPWNK